MKFELDGLSPDPMFKTFKDFEAVTQEYIPVDRRPRDIKHVVLDADDTIWFLEPMNLASMCKPVGETEGDKLPIKCEGGYGKKDVEGNATLEPTLRETLAELKKRGIPVSLASSNERKPVVELLKAFDIEDKFSSIKVSFSQNKANMVEEIARENNINPKEILFVNDSAGNVADVAMNTGATSLIAGWNIDKLSDLLEFIK